MGSNPPQPRAEIGQVGVKMQHIFVGGVTGELDFNMVEFLTNQIGSDWFNEVFEFKDTPDGKYKPKLGLVFSSTLATFKSFYGVI